MHLHSGVSQSVAQILPQLSREHFVNQDNGEQDSFDLVENVLITGRALGGFFDQDISTSTLEKSRGYQGRQNSSLGDFFLCD